MTIALLNETFKGISELKMYRHSDGLLYHLPTPQNFVLQDQKEQRMQYTRDWMGRRTRANTYVVATEASLSISYSVVNPELLAFRIGTYFESKTNDLYFTRSYTVTQNNFPAYALGSFGKGIVADADAKASKKVGYISTPLTIQPYATFTPATANSFAVGADGALKFSDNLVAARETVSVMIPYTLTGLSIGDEIVGGHSLVAHLVTTENKVVVFTAFNVTPDLNGASIDASAEGLEIPLFVNIVPGGCYSYQMVYTNLSVEC